MAVPKSKALKVLVEQFSKFQTKNMSVAKSRPFTVLVEGNIGCGKTTFLQHFAKVRQQMLNTRQQRKTQNNRQQTLHEYFTNTKQTLHRHYTNRQQTSHNIQSTHDNRHLSLSFQSDSSLNPPQFGHVDVLKEPVDRWRDLNGNNLLQLMYEDPQRLVNLPSKHEWLTLEEDKEQNVHICFPIYSLNIFAGGRCHSSLMSS